VKKTEYQHISDICYIKINCFQNPIDRNKVFRVKVDSFDRMNKKVKVRLEFMINLKSNLETNEIDISENEFNKFITDQPLLKYTYLENNYGLSEEEAIFLYTTPLHKAKKLIKSFSKNGWLFSGNDRIGKPCYELFEKDLVYKGNIN